MKKTMIAALIAFGFGFSACRGTADKVSGGEEFEGWRKQGTDDVFFMRISGSASLVAKESGEEARMKVTCIESTKLQAQDTIIRKLVGENVEAVSGTVDGETKNHLIVSMRSGVIRGTEMKECAARTGKWATCECVHFVKGPALRQKFKLQVEKAMKEAGVQ